MSPETRWRLLLRAYPRADRDARGEEILAVLLAAEQRRGRWSALPEAASLVGHGLARRVRPSYAGPPRASSAALAGVSLVLLLAVLGAHQLAAMALRGLGLDGAPDAWQLWRLWVDPRWPIHLAWLAAGATLVLRRHRTALFLTWAAAALLVWQGLADRVAGLPLPWIGDLVGPSWDAPFGPGQVGSLLLTGLAAALSGGPVRLGRALASAPGRSWARVLMAGLLASAVSLAAAPWLARLTGPDVGLVESGRGAAVLALGATSAGLLGILARTVTGRRTTLLLAATALIPLTTRWTAPGSLPVACLAACLAAALFTAGYVAGTRRHASTGATREPTAS